MRLGRATLELWQCFAHPASAKVIDVHTAPMSRRPLSATGLFVRTCRTHTLVCLWFRFRYFYRSCSYLIKLRNGHAACLPHGRRIPSHSAAHAKALIATARCVSFIFLSISNIIDTLYSLKCTDATTFSPALCTRHTIYQFLTSPSHPPTLLHLYKQCLSPRL